MVEFRQGEPLRSKEFGPLTKLENTQGLLGWETRIVKKRSGTFGKRNFVVGANIDALNLPSI